MTDTAITRIRALLAKSRDPGASEAEAASAASLAERLLARHALSMADVEVQEISARKTGLRYLEPWVRNMAAHAARLYGCEPLVVEEYADSVSRKTGRPMRVQYRSITVYGREVNTEVAVSMITYLYDTVIRMSRDHSRERREQLQFQRGAGERLATRLWEMKESQNARSETSDGQSDGTSIVVVEQMEALSHIKSMMDVSPVRGTSSDTRSASSHAGWDAGGRVSLGGQIGGRAAGPARLN